MPRSNFKKSRQTAGFVIAAQNNRSSARVSKNILLTQPCQRHVNNTLANPYKSLQNDL
jgi:hypothetical protein